MEEDEIVEFHVQHPSGYKTLVLFLCQVIFLVFVTRRQDGVVIGVASAILILVYLIAIGLLISRIVKKNTITLGSDFLLINGNEQIQEDQIKDVLIYGNRIGVRLTGKTMVPVRLCFKFINSDRARGEEELKRWAKENEKPIVFRFFMMWI
jgi:hypothetical protein